MKIFPAIDIYDDKAVRLVGGDYSKMTVYGDPLEMAKKFKEAGATDLHIVDLKGAKEKKPFIQKIASRIVNETGLTVQLGGGIREIETIEQYLASGVERVILGTSAVKSPRLLEKAARDFEGRIAVSVDIRDGYVSTEGWLDTSDLYYTDMFKRLDELKIGYAVCTDISKDGMLSGTNTELYSELSANYKTAVIASGGISSIEDIVRLDKMGIYGAIVGKALYEGRLDLYKIFEVLNGNEKDNTLS